MATYVNNLRLKEITTGDEDGTWGTSTNTNLELITDGFSYGTKEMAADANETFTMPDATADDTRSFYLKITSAVSLTATREVTLGPNTVSKVWMIENATSGSQIITIKQGSGATVNVPNGSKVMVVTDGAGAGAAVLNANPTEVGGTVTSVGGTGTVNGITLTGTVTSSGNLTLGGALTGVNLTSQVTGTLPIANGGTGSTSTTFANLTTNVTGTLPVANGGTGSTTASGALTNLGLTATAAELNTLDGITATTTELNYTDGVTSNIQTQLNAKGVGSVTSVAVSGGTTGLTTSGGPITGSGTITLAGTLAVANGGTGVTSSTGSGSVVLSTSPTLATPNLGTPSAATLTNATGLPISTGVSGLGSNVATFLATPSSANLATAVTGETGSGALVFGTSPTLADPTFSAGYIETVYALSGTALDPANGTLQTKTLAANTTFTESLTSGESLVLMLGAGASYTVTWPTITWVTSAGNVAPTLTANDTLVFWKISTTLYGAYVGSYA
jgi:hypothetical protein